MTIQETAAAIDTLDRTFVECSALGFQAMLTSVMAIGSARHQLEGRIALAAVPALTAKHLPCLNDSPRLLDLLAQQVRQCAASCAAVPGAAVTCYRLCTPGAVTRAVCALCAAPGGAATSSVPVVIRNRPGQQIAVTHAHP